MNPKVGEIWEVSLPSLSNNAIVIVTCAKKELEHGVCIDLDMGEGFTGIITREQSINELWAFEPIRRIQEAE